MPQSTYNNHKCKSSQKRRAGEEKACRSDSKNNIDTVCLAAKAMAMEVDMAALLLTLLLTSFCCGRVVVVVATDPKVPAFIVFGDSTADVGMNTFVKTPVKANFAPYGESLNGGHPTGRFTNGLLVSDYIALKLGLPLILPFLDPKAEGELLLKGVSFASGGTGYIQSTSTLTNVVTPFDQLKMFYQYQMKLVNLVGQARTSFIMSKALFAISAGSNDYILNYNINPLIQSQYTTTEWSSFILSNQTELVKQLYKAGARNVLVYGLPPIGCLPAVLTIAGKDGSPNQGCLEDKNQATINYNIKLREAIPTWSSELPGLRVLYGDAYTYLEKVANNPSKYGYMEARRGCCAEGLISLSFLCNAKRHGTCSDPSTYIFFDSVHPTQRVYKAMAEEIWPILAAFLGIKS